MLVDKKTGEIYLYAPIGQDWYGDGITGELMIQALDSLGGKRATVRINSPGGVVDEGVAIYNALKRYSGGVDTVVDALAASIASIIALAGESRTTAAGARWMVHSAMTIGIGNSADMTKLASVLATHDESLAEIYSGYMGKSKDEVLAIMAAETWYTTDEAITAGLSTGKDGQATQPNVANWFRNAPAALYKEAALRPKVAVNRQRAGILARV